MHQEIAKQQKLMQEQLAAQQKMFQDQLIKHQEEIKAINEAKKKEMEIQTQNHLKQLYKNTKSKKSLFGKSAKKSDKNSSPIGEESGISAAVSMTISMLVTMIYFLFVNQLF